MENQRRDIITEVKEVRTADKPPQPRLARDKNLTGGEKMDDT